MKYSHVNMYINCAVVEPWPISLVQELYKVRRTQHSQQTPRVDCDKNVFCMSFLLFNNTGIPGQYVFHESLKKCPGIEYIHCTYS